MTRTAQALAAMALVVVAACQDSPSGLESTPLSAASVSAAFSTVPLGYSEVASSYAGDGDGSPSLWMPGPHSAAFGMGAMMGGGLGDPFLGGIGFGRFGHQGPFGGPFGGGLRCTGSFDASSGRFVCDPVTRDGLTFTQSAAYTNAAGQVQQAFDTATTNTVNVRTSVTGTVSFERESADDRHRGRGPGPRPHFAGRLIGDTTTILTATTTVRHASDRTVSGLAQGSTRRTVDGASKGEESTTGTSSRGDFTATRTAADTTRGIIVPLENGRPTYPTAGTVIRVMNASVTFAGSAAVTSSRREVVAYDGSATAKVTITVNGETKQCTLPLPHGRLSCE
ncbi:MAG TPA: hypothetical protein VFM38_03645 [Candidatus Limnocylindrales bacterium]|nr:hypothetical protein [Candidatus Limnocylindrales bacterium]